LRVIRRRYFKGKAIPINVSDIIEKLINFKFKRRVKSKYNVMNEELTQKQKDLKIEAEDENNLD
jgi:hypothetical protein